MKWILTKYNDLKIVLPCTFPPLFVYCMSAIQQAGVVLCGCSQLNCLSAGSLFLTFLMWGIWLFKAKNIRGFVNCGKNVRLWMFQKEPASLMLPQILSPWGCCYRFNSQSFSLSQNCLRGYGSCRPKIIWILPPVLSAHINLKGFFPFVFSPTPFTCRAV